MNNNYKSLSLTLLFLLLTVPTLKAEIVAPTKDFSQAEKNEIRQGGATTSFKKINRNSYSHASANMSFERELNFKVGNGFFRRIWVSAPASTQAADGLGPLFNAKSCQRCHLKDGRGHPPTDNWPDDTAVSMFLRLSIPAETEQQKQLLKSHQAKVIAEPTYGGQLQDFSIQGHSAEGRMHIEYDEMDVKLSAGQTASLRKPTYSVTDLAYGPLHPKTMLSPRVAPHMLGLGLLELIPNEDLEALADPDDKNADGISGRTNKVFDPEMKAVEIGRFGWKAGAPSVSAQNSGAFNGDIGLSVPLAKAGSGECTVLQKECIDAINGNSPQYDNLEVNQEIVDLVLFYSRNLAVPARRHVDDANVLQGKQLFYQTGCIACHQPAYITEKSKTQVEQSEQHIWPYTDLLLHDMGEGLADHRPEADADGFEWRTAPLWGIGLTKKVSGHTQFLHDGRARNLLEAILWHGGEAQPARNKVVSMTPQQRDNLISFLESL